MFGWAPAALAALLATFLAALAAALAGGLAAVLAVALASGFDRLYYFVFTSSLFSHGLKGTIATTSLARVF
jgi:hypothetical protein